MLFLPPNQHQSTEGKSKYEQTWTKYTHLSFFCQYEFTMLS